MVHFLKHRKTDFQYNTKTYFHVEETSESESMEFFVRAFRTGKCVNIWQLYVLNSCFCMPMKYCVSQLDDFLSGVW